MMRLIIVVALCWAIIPARSQCSYSPPAASTCSGGNGPGFDGVNINGGDTYWFSGGPTTWTNVNLNGGTLRVCGDLTLDAINFNSGNLIIETGGSLTINAGLVSLNGNSSVINRGSLSISGDVSMQNANNTIWNGALATVDISSQLTINSATSNLFNEGGNFTAGSISIQSASIGAVCATDQSCFTLGGGGISIINNFADAWVFSGTGQAAITYTGDAQLNSTFTSYSNFNVCGAPGSTVSGAGGFGSATTGSPPCRNCAGVILPMQVLYFRGKLCDFDEVCLTWAVASQVNEQPFIVEKSADGYAWQVFETVESATGDNATLDYQTIDSYPYDGKNYYRLKQVDFDGQYQYSKVVSVNFDNQVPSASILVYPNPTADRVTVTAYQSELSDMKIYDTLGIDVTARVEQLSQSENKVVLDLSKLPTGGYIIKTSTMAVKTYKR